MEMSWPIHCFCGNKVNQSIFNFAFFFSFFVCVIVCPVAAGWWQCRRHAVLPVTGETQPGAGEDTLVFQSDSRQSAASSGITRY